MKQQEAKKWFQKCIILLVSFLVLIVLVMVVVDPYFHYHGPLKGMSYRLYEERYINDGITRHFDYDAVITGTSMSQNFKTSEMDALFGTNSIKVPFSGAGYQEISQNLERALKRNENIKMVLWTVDYNGFLREYDWAKYDEYPTYLYDENPWNDAAYLLNKSILYHGVLPNIKKTLTGESPTSMDEYSSWAHETGLEHIGLIYTRGSMEKAENTEFGEEEYEMVKTTIQTNFINLIEQYPEVEFYLFYTPYSICYWDTLSLKGTAMQQIQAEQAATELFLQCPNVKLFNFFDQYDVVCELNYYNDEGHYSAEVNSKILMWIAEGTGQITVDNYKEKLEDEKDFYLNYDYEAIYR